MRYLLLSTLCLCSCQNAHPPAAATAPLPLTPETPAPTPAALVRQPERVRTYTLGAYVDPADPMLRHEAHQVHRIEAPAQWSLKAHCDVQGPKPEVTLPIGPSAPSVAGPDISAKAALSQVAPLPPLEPALMPDGEGVIDLTAGGPADEENPFAVRTTDASATREISLLVSGLLRGPAGPMALVNGRPLQAGDCWESLQLVRIEADTVLFGHGTQLLRLPVSRTAVRLKLPR